MEIIKKIANKQDFYNNKPVTIAILGDSVSHGCFECYMDGEVLQTIYDTKSSYGTRLKEILNILYPSSQINIINSGISGDSAGNGYARIERDILSYNPDLCIVSYQLNDSCQKEEGIELYKNHLKNIFKTLKSHNVEIIFLTENTMCTSVSNLLPTQTEQMLAKDFSDIQNSGIEKMYRDAAIETCKSENIKYVDIYSIWEKFINNKVNLDYILANKLNHPIRPFHYYIAIKIIELMLED